MKCLFVFLVTFTQLIICTNSNAQKSSNVDARELSQVIQKAKRAGYFYIPNTNDAYLMDSKKQNKEAYNRLLEKNVGVIRMYPARLYTTINSYSFADSFSNYFYFDTSSCTIYFYSNKAKRGIVFAQTNSIKKANNLRPITHVRLPEGDFYANYRWKRKSFFMLALEHFFIVKDNCMYVILGDGIKKASDYFKEQKYDFDVLTKAFIGLQPDKLIPELYPAPK